MLTKCQQKKCSAAMTAGILQYTIHILSCQSNIDELQEGRKVG